MKIADYLLMRPPHTKRMGDMPEEKVPTGRILLSLVGILAGIIFSFYVTDLQPASKAEPVSIQKEMHRDGNAGDPIGSPEAPKPKMKLAFSLEEFWATGIISLVICMISYQGLYLSLKLYNNERAFLVIFVSFQYGYFWQSVIKGGSAVVGS